MPTSVIPALGALLAFALVSGCDDDGSSSANGTPSGTGGVTGTGGSGIGTGGTPGTGGDVEPGGDGDGDGIGTGDGDGDGDGSEPVDAALLAKGWERVWADEFDGDGIDEARWQHAVDCWGGGNNEDQCYVDEDDNTFVADGRLHLVALKDSPTGAVGGPDGDGNIVGKGHSSGKLTTQGMGDMLYGRIEVRARLPFGQGIWPAIWMMPTDSEYGGWARSGEIDIMEAINLKAAGAEPNRVHGTLHYGDGWPNNVHSGEHHDPPGDVTTEFHTYAVEWERGEIRWYVDDVHFATQNTWYSAGNAYPAPFDKRFYLILNLAVGGEWPGWPDDTTTFPQELVLEYVRVYRCAADPTDGIGCGTVDPAVVPLAGNAGP